MEFDKVIDARHSVRNFKTTKKPDYRDIISAIEASTKAPLAGNINSIKYILIQDKKKIKELAEAAQQSFISQVDYVVVIISDKKALVKNYLQRGEIYSRQQAGAAIENLILKITELGLSTCWVGAFSDEMVRRIAEIPEELDIEAILPIGYELGKARPHKEPNLDRVLSFDGYGIGPAKSERKYMIPRKTTAGEKT